MNANTTRSLIKTMLASGELMPETVEELEEYLQEIDKGTLDAMDVDYVQGLAKRLGFAKGRAPAAAAAEAAEADEEADEDEADAAAERAAEADAAAERAEEAEVRVAALEATLESREAALASVRQSIGDARERLAALYDPEKGLNRDIDDAKAAEALKEIWTSLEQAEAQAAEE
jgi:uncharacterized coiled-coil protein SlyX